MTNVGTDPQNQIASFHEFSDPTIWSFKIGYVSLIKESTFKHINQVETATNCSSCFSKIHDTILSSSSWRYEIVRPWPFLFVRSLGFFSEATWSLTHFCPFLWCIPITPSSFSYSMVPCIMCNHPLRPCVYIRWMLFFIGDLSFEVSSISDEEYSTKWCVASLDAFRGLPTGHFRCPILITMGLLHAPAELLPGTAAMPLDALLK